MNTVYKLFITTLSVCLMTSCSGAGESASSGRNGGLTFDQIIQSAFNELTLNGFMVLLNGELIADLGRPAPVVSSLGTVAQGTTLNRLVHDDLSFLIYGNDGVFAAECEVSSLDPTFGPSHPLCQMAHVENYDTVVVCYSNSVDTDVMVAQNWPGTATAFDSGHGMICYVDGIKMRSTHIFTY